MAVKAFHRCQEKDRRTGRFWEGLEASEVVHRAAFLAQSSYSVRSSVGGGTQAIGWKPSGWVMGH